MPYSAQRPELFIGTTTGSGEGVALVRRAAHAPPTSFWRRGDRAKGNTQIKPGTVIATFDPIGRYGNRKDHTSHAAIHVGQTPDGIQVIDRWNEISNHKPWHHHRVEDIPDDGGRHFDKWKKGAEDVYLVCNDGDALAITQRVQRGATACLFLNRKGGPDVVCR